MTPITKSNVWEQDRDLRIHISYGGPPAKTNACSVSGEYNSRKGVAIAYLPHFFFVPWRHLCSPLKDGYSLCNRLLSCWHYCSSVNPTTKTKTRSMHKHVITSMSHSPRSYSISREMKHAETSSPHILDKWLSHYTLILNIHVQFPQSTLLVKNADCTWSGLINYTEVALLVYLCKCISVLVQVWYTSTTALNYRLQVSTSQSKYFDSLPLASKEFVKRALKMEFWQQPFRTSIQCRISIVWKLKRVKGHYHPITWWIPNVLVIPMAI